MRTFINNFGERVTDQKNYHVDCSNAEDDFITIRSEEFYTDFNKARSFAIEKSKFYKAVDLCCEQWIEDSMFDAPMTIWRERYENGKKQWREGWI